MHKHIMDGHVYASCNRSSQSWLIIRKGHGLGCRRPLFWGLNWEDTLDRRRRRLRQHDREGGAVPKCQPLESRLKPQIEPRSRSLSMVREGGAFLDQIDSAATRLRVELWKMRQTLQHGSAGQETEAGETSWQFRRTACSWRVSSAVFWSKYANPGSGST
jgi:hypothetical protein